MPRILDEIRTLDPVSDHLRIVYLSTEWHCRLCTNELRRTQLLSCFPHAVNP